MKKIDEKIEIRKHHREMPRPDYSISPTRMLKGSSESPVSEEKTDYAEFYVKEIDNIFQRNYPKELFVRKQSEEEIKFVSPKKNYKYQHNYDNQREPDVREPLNSNFRNSPDPNYRQIPSRQRAKDNGLDSLHHRNVSYDINQESSYNGSS